MGGVLVEERGQGLRGAAAAMPVLWGGLPRFVCVCACVCCTCVFVLGRGRV